MINISASLGEFFYMGGFGDIIWPSWALTLFVLIYNIVIPRIKMKQLHKMINDNPKPNSHSGTNKSTPDNIGGKL
ncbi:hypothetical protein MNBD_GAMMA12-2853 [hydrothermal vent metagenome]|uniref:Uncharacterized protein n=1 Tax=hydrothermal vent metagenome TaxID=652676 RepID=A0A3B0YUP2_9ZZZZ